MEKLTIEQLLALSKEDLAKYITELDTSQTEEIENLKTEVVLLKGENSKMKKATLGFVASAKVVEPKKSDERFDLSEIL